MTIPFKKLKARLLANPKVKAEYDTLAGARSSFGRLLMAAPIAPRDLPKRNRSPARRVKL
jgi:hypothetical protein